MKVAVSVYNFGTILLDSCGDYQYLKVYVKCCDSILTSVLNTIVKFAVVEVIIKLIDAVVMCINLKMSNLSLYKPTWVAPRFDFAQWRYRSLWSLSEARLLLVENYSQCPALLTWNIVDCCNFSRPSEADIDRKKQQIVALVTCPRLKPRRLVQCTVHIPRKHF